jgi:hypothetical protein
MMIKTNRGLELDLLAIPHVHLGGWACVSTRGERLGAWTLRTLSRDLLGVHVGVWVEEDYSRSSDESRTYAFCVQFRERGGGSSGGIGRGIK